MLQQTTKITIIIQAYIKLKVLYHRNADEEACTWFLQLLTRLLEESKKVVPPSSLVARHEHSQRIVFYTDLVLLCLVVWANGHGTHGVEKLSQVRTLS